MEDTRTILFSCGLNLANGEILWAIDYGLLFLRLLISQWIMICSGLFFSVGLIYNSIATVFAPRKDLTANKLSLVDSSQVLTFFRYTVSNKHCNTTALVISLFLFCFYAYVDLSLCYHFWYLLVMISLLWHY